ncbi:tetratricopeptide repeat protein [Scytonema sp. NUACC26]|uniref:tetratricopeptide repeat protein n=1 Tax=Scytonema sp. NUACC26 TaxID=3140176 RepID=UPI0034DB852A
MESLAYLKLGSKGDQVVELKNRLLTLDYLDYSDKDGNIFDTKTEEAVKKFQKDNNLKVDGIVETKTNEALFEAIWPSSLSGRALFNRGLKQSQFSDALRDYNEAIKRDENLAEAYYRRGMLYAYVDLDFGDFPQDLNKALENFNKAIKINPDYVEAYLERGIIHNEKKDWKSAIDDWTQAILIEPDNKEAYYRRAKAKEQLKNTEDIINDYIEVIKVKLKLEQDADLKKQVEQVINNFQNDRVSPELMLALSRGVASTGVSDIFLRREEEYSSSANEDIGSLYKSTIKGLEKAINNLGNTQEQNLLVLLYYYKALNQYELEKDRLKKREIIQLLLDNFDPKNTSKQNTFASTYYYRGLLFLEIGEQEEAKKEFDKAIERQPNFTKAYYLRGIIRSKQGDEQGAISDFNKYLQRDPEMEEAKKMRDYPNDIILEAQKVCFSQEIPKEYLETLESSVPLDAPAYLKRGKLRFLLGDYPGAKKDFQEVIKAEPNLAADAYYQQGKVAAYEFYFLTEQTDDEQVLKKAKEAKENFDEAIKKNPNFSEAYFERGYLQYKIVLKYSKNSRNTVFNKQTDVAWIDDCQNDFKQAIKIDKNFAQAYYLMVVTERYRFRIQVEQQAEQTGQNINLIKIEDVKNYNLSSTEIKNLTEAIRNDISFYLDFIGVHRLTMKRAICVDLVKSKQDNTTKPGNIISFKSKKEYSYYTIALDNYRKKEYKQAIENISQAIKLNPDISDYYVIRGAAYYFYKHDNEYYKAAFKDFQVSIQLEPRLTSLISIIASVNIPDTTYSSSISHFLMGRIIENQDISQKKQGISQKEYYIALKYLPQVDWIIGPGGGGSQTQRIPRPRP